MRATPMKKPGRNEPCPCGSGKKYKQCCQRQDETQATPARVAGTSVPDAITLAMAHHEAGRLSQAEAIYQQILQAEPNNPRALRLLGLIAFQVGKYDIAVELIGRALSFKPDYAEAHNNLGAVLQAQGRLEAAIASFRQALAFKSDYAEVHNNLGAVLQAQGKLEAAAESYRQTVSLKPNYTEAHNNLGNVLQAQGKLDAAIQSFRQALALKPDYAEVHNNLGTAFQVQGQLNAAAESFRQALWLKPDYAEAHNNLGILLKMQDSLDSAAESFRRALALRPDYAEAHNNLGNVLYETGKIEGAIESFRRTLALNPNHAKAHNNLGNAFRDREELDAAVICFQKAIALKPDYAEAHNNLGNALQDQGKLDAAIASFHTALTIKPDYVEAHWNESLALLAQGRLIEGWVKHDWRLQQKENIPDYRNLPSLRPMFSGENLAGKTILVWAEQGLGDELFYAGVLSDVIRAAGHCVIECDPRLVPLYARSFPTAEIIPKCYPPHPRTQQPDIELQCPVGNLPRWFRPSIESFPRHHGYLVPDPQRVAFWKQRLDALGPAPKVGITWRSKHRNQWRNLHYTELSQWGPILTVPGLIFINLQYDDCRAELEAARKQFGVEIHAWDDIDQMNDLDELTALMAALDLVIAPTTTPAIMAGALGAPAWMLLTRHITWKTLGTESIPMFPDMRLIWRPRNVKWDVVLEAVAVELKRAPSL
jgi:tetratricopeptide (TPR) repeat protein